jgi:dephospho-CoA kinase
MRDKGALWNPDGNNAMHLSYGILPVMRVIGLTGNIGSGKSTVASYMAGKRAYTLDADKIAHEVILPGEPAYEAIVENFGPSILRSDGLIDRQALAAIVFADSKRLTALEDIIHPAVANRVRELVGQSTAPVVVIEAIKLLEAGRLIGMCDEIWVVTADEEAMMRRLVESRGMDPDDVRRRLAAQSSQEEKMSRATRVIRNSGTSAELQAQLDVIWAEMMAGPVTATRAWQV